jgi:hypothetical protein
MTALFQHYLPPSPSMLPYVAGRFYASHHWRIVGVNNPVTANLLYCSPYVLARSGRFSAMAVNVTTGAAGLLRMALAADNGAGQPGTIVEEPLVNADTGDPGSAVCAFAQPRWIPAGVWWLLMCFSGTPTVRGYGAQAFGGGTAILLGSPIGDGGASGGAGTDNGFSLPLTYQAGVRFMPNSPTDLSYLGPALAPVPTLQAA